MLAWKQADKIFYNLPWCFSGRPKPGKSCQATGRVAFAFLNFRYTKYLFKAYNFCATFDAVSERKTV